MAAVERIELRGVTRLFGSVAALRGVNLELRGGEITIIEGPNGAGKSTLLGIVGTLVAPTAGRVLYEPDRRDGRGARSEIGWVAHESQCYRELTGRENVELVAALHGLPVGEAWDRVAGRVALGHFAERPVGTLSRGQRQRVALARALVHSPSVLLLDEPSSGLDAESVKALERVVIEHRDEGGLVVIVSHRADLAESVGGRRVRIEQGRVVGQSADSITP